jgi:hypothetical protein
MQGSRDRKLVMAAASSLLVALSVACLDLPTGGGGGPAGETGGSPSTGGRSSSDVPVCAALFDGACEQPSYEYYLALCENENAGTVVDILDCVVPDCKTPVDAGTEFCIQLAIEDEQSEEVSSLMYDVESICGSQLDNAQVRVVYIHAASINDRDRLLALADCLSRSYCTEIVDCLTEPEVAPWWED